MPSTHFSGKTLPATLLPSSSWDFVVLAAGLGAATAVDIRSRRIPNSVTVTMAGAGVAFAAAGLSGLSLGAAVLGLVVGLAVMLPGHALGATGAGDVKLMAAVGSLLGPATVVNAFVFTAVAGGVLAIAVALWRRQFAEMLAGTARLVVAPAAAGNEIRTAPRSRRFAYGPAIAIGSLIAALMR